MKNWLMIVFLLWSLAVSSPATVLTFEGFAPAGGLVNVNPTAPYQEAGYTLTPLNSEAAVFDAGASSKFPGDNTSWFGFEGGNTITLTGPVPFDLNSALLGPSTIGSGIINLTVVGHLFGGGTVTVSFNGLTTATLEAINFTDLQSATLTSNSDAGMDNVSVTAVPEPSCAWLFGGGLIALAGLRRWRPCIAAKQASRLR